MQLINWFTVGAQIINFLVLLALLKWLLFDRVTRAMDERQRTIADRLEEARRKQEEANQRERELQRKHHELDEQREGLLDDAKQQAARQREEMTDQAREQVEQSRQQWREELADQQERFLDDITRRAGEALGRGVHQALRDLADTELNRQAIEHFVGKLQAIDDDTRDRFQQALQENADAGVVVATAHDLPDEQRHRVSDAVRTLGKGEGSIDVSFQQADELIAGAELRVGGHAIGWNLRQYLDRFDENLRQHLARQP